MNAMQAKEQIVKTFKAYQAKDEFGQRLIPQNRQRPLFLIGAPGVGKTAVVEQAAEELNVPLVSYSMTHHTRQSAIGLPYIVDEVFDGETVRTTKYTMSEILAAVYKAMEETGKSEGILFLDEVNCVSETLAPAMLQFLQYKVFGQRKLPDGWMIVTAGNPAQYNDSVHELDMVTMDRLKKISVDIDFDAWVQYAVSIKVNQAVVSFLNLYKDSFSKSQRTPDGLRFVTPRGWVDLAEFITVEETLGEEISMEMIEEYIQDPQIARDFSHYYDLWKCYRTKFNIDGIFAGKASPAELKGLKFDEKISLIGLIMEKATVLINPVMESEKVMEGLKNALMAAQQCVATRKSSNLQEAMQTVADEYTEKLETRIANNMVSRTTSTIERAVITKIRDFAVPGTTVPAMMDEIKKMTKARNTKMKEVGTQLSNAIEHVKAAFGDGQELTILITELTRSSICGNFIQAAKVESYYQATKGLQLTQRETEIVEQISLLDLAV